MLNTITMYKILFLCIFAMLGTSYLQAQAPKKPVKQTSAPKTIAVTKTVKEAYQIPVTILPYTNTKIYMGSYYGKSNTLVDSAMLDADSKGVFKGNKKLTPGIYFLVSPQYSIICEFLMDNEQKFSIYHDTLNRTETKIIGSIDNELFKQYSSFSITKGRKIQQLNEALAKATTTNDSIILREQLRAENQSLQQYRNNIIKKYPASLLTALFNAMKQPEVPEIPIVNGKADSTYPYRYVKEHFWDDVNFYDDRLLRTPFFESKVDDYFKRFVVPDADSIYPEVKYMLLMARTGKEMYPYLLTKFTNKYINPEYMGLDKVFLNIFEDFYAKGDTVYLSAAGKKTVFERAYSIMANQLGSPAPALVLSDTLNKKADLYALKSKFTMVVFWDPTCGHCKEEIPRLDSMYRAKWKNLGMMVYSVNVNEAKMTEFKQFIAEKGISKDWVQAYQNKKSRDDEAAAGLPNYRQLYDVYKTPTLYLLDEKKQIIAKQLTIEQFDEILTVKLKRDNKAK